jgi:AcrR family transcriptional regulator
LYSLLIVRSDPDLTARANIRNAALRLFAERGHEAVSVRQIAAEAGVSPGLVLHHFTSKEGLREAVDRYAAERLEVLLAEDQDQVAQVFSEGDSGSVAEAFARMFPPDSPLPAYVRRLLLSGDPAGTQLFRRWFEGTRAFLDQMVSAGFAAPTGDPDVRAGFALASDLALLLLRDPLTAVLGFDPLSPEGLPRWAEEASAILRGGMFLQPDAPRPDDTED